MRTVDVLGRMTDRKVVRLARRCAWCSTWHTTEDQEAAQRGAKITHGCCTACLEKLEAQIGPKPGPEAA